MDTTICRTKNGYEFKISPRRTHLLDSGPPWYGIQLKSKGHDRTYTYIVRQRRKGRGSSHIGLHRVIMEEINQAPLAKNICVDHINGDTLDCRDENLRCATRQQNRQNGVCDRNNRSGYRGVSWNTKRREWHCTIMKDGKYHFIGWFKDKHEAARRYNKKASELYGAFAKLNEVQDA